MYLLSTQVAVSVSQQEVFDRISLGTYRLPLDVELTTQTATCPVSWPGEAGRPGCVEVGAKSCCSG